LTTKKNQKRSRERERREKMSLDVHVARRAMLQEDLVKLEKQIFDLEGTYLEETAQTGNILRGWEG
jgi:hypothetical protein